MILAALAVAAALGVSDPSPATAPQVRAGEMPERRPASAAAVRPAEARSSYLTGRLLARTGDAAGGRAALERALVEEPLLVAWTRQELAELDLAGGDTEAAARQALLALDASTDRRLRERAHAVLRRAAEGGGGCRALRAAPPAPRRSRADARRLELLVADCDLAAGDLAAAGSRWQALLREGDHDRVAQDLLERHGLRERLGLPRPALPDDLLGTAAARQRDFARAVPALERALGSATGERRIELAVTLARSRFWLGEHRAAAVALETLAAGIGSPPRRAEALSHAARAWELAGDFGAALAGHRAAEAAAPHGPWADASRLGIARLAGRAGTEGDALAALARFGSSRQSASARGRALLFLAAEDLTTGRRDRAASWLARARPGNPQLEPEIAYWRGRLAELEQRPAAAIASYRAALGQQPHRPFARAAAERLRSPGLRPAAEAAAARLAGGTLGEQLGAVALRQALGLADATADARLRDELAREPRFATFLALEPLAAERLPLPPPALDDGPTRLLRLGLWHDGAAAAGPRFAARPEWALGAAPALVEAGAPTVALALADGVAARAPAGLPERWWPAAVRLALVPPAHRDAILTAAARRGVDPALLAAILREESRFDPLAFSPAAARGIAQFVLPTASRIAADLGLTGFTADWLERPEIAIELAAAHLAELAARYGGRPELVAAAYNAGSAQVDAWLRTCKTEDSAEFLSKVAFRETRAYLARVLESRGRYAERPDWRQLPTP